jgi:hypothetical protein
VEYRDNVWQWGSKGIKDIWRYVRGFRGVWRDLEILKGDIYGIYLRGFKGI